MISLDIKQVEKIEVKEYNFYNGITKCDIQTNSLYVILMLGDLVYFNEDIILHIIENTDYNDRNTDTLKYYEKRVFEDNFLSNNDSFKYSDEYYDDNEEESIIEINNTFKRLYKIFLKHKKYNELIYFIRNVFYDSLYKEEVINYMENRVNNYIQKKVLNNITKEIRKVNKI